MERRKITTIGIGGPVGVGKTTLITCLCTELQDEFSVGVITNDIRTTSDADFLVDKFGLKKARVNSVVTGETKRGIFRHSSGLNRKRIEKLRETVTDVELIMIEGVGDRQDARFGRKLVDEFIYIIDATAGERIPLKGGPGIVHSGLLIVNKIDLIDGSWGKIGALTLNIQNMRKRRPYVFTAFRTGFGLDLIVDHIREIRNIQRRRAN